jgi:hypothetical protein
LTLYQLTACGLLGQPESGREQQGGGQEVLRSFQLAPSVVSG